jgi:dihydropyrimidinase
MFDIVIRNGKVVSDGSLFEASVAITGETIEALCAPSVPLPSAETIDARGAYVIPGAIDPHLHFKTFNTMVDDFETAAVSAAYGGVTTVIPFIGGEKGMSVAETLDLFLDEGRRSSVVDFAMHCRLLPDLELIEQIPDAVRRGVTSIKMLLDYRKRGLLFDDYLLLRAMELCAEQGGLAMVHAENGYVIDYLEDKFIARGQTGPEYYLRSRPHVTESEAVARSITLAALAGCPLYVVHLSAREGLEEIVRARDAGKPVYAETCPQYLLLTDAEVTRQKGLAKIGPPLRWDPDREAMWSGLRHGAIQTVGSDHAPFAIADKQVGEHDIFRAPFGMPGVETMLPLLFSEGLRQGGLSIPDLVRVSSENAARIFGLYPKKGAIKVGADADIVLLDPESEWTVTADALHSKAGYTCYEGWRVKGRVVLSLLRGRPLLKDGKLCQSPGYGRFVPRTPTQGAQR